jgi:maltooligosyltrehalose trehalohydrolase
MWRLPFGSTVLSTPNSSAAPQAMDGRNCGSQRTATEFRLWSSRAKQVTLQIVERGLGGERIAHSQSLELEADGIFRTVVRGCDEGTRYRYQLDQGPARPDPYSRFQPFGVHGPSQVIDPDRFEWTDSSWRGIPKRDLVIYELHLGSFTREGTYQAAIQKLPQLVDLGVNAIEFLPLAQSPGRWNWGYDGVNFFAPRNTFGTPHDLKALINSAHALGIAAILDVVYNHVGPEGNYLNEFAHYRSSKYGTPWGDALDFDQRLVRDFIIDNGIYWLDEFHFDGLRLDAIHYMFDDTMPSMVQEFAQRFRAYQASTNRQLHLIAESNIFDAGLLTGKDNQPHYDAIWSDCLMHSLYSHGKPDLRLTNRHYSGTADVVESLEHAYIFTAPGAIRVSREPRPASIANEDLHYQSSLIMALQTHDSVGNHPHGKRLHHLIDLDFQRAAAPLVLLYPSIPMLFMGEEWATSAPFPFFADFEDEGLRRAVDRGRQEEYPHHDWNGSPLPSDPLAFFSSKLDDAQSCRNTWTWYQQLLALRRRGLREGWLDVQHKRTHYDAEQDIFYLIYELASEKIVIASRLTRKIPSPARIALTEQHEILLDSHSDILPEGLPNDPVPLQKHHCRIWRERRSMKEVRFSNELI